MRDVHVVGTGQTTFGEDERTLRELGADAASDALADSRARRDDVDGAYVGNVGGPADSQRSIVGQIVLREVGLSGIPIVNVENACSSSANALGQAYRDIAGGFRDVVLVLGVEKMTGVSTEEATGGLGGSSDIAREAMRGFTFPSKYAMGANAYEATYEPANLRDALTAISVKNHRNALENPYAHFSKEISERDVEESPLIADPLRLYDMSPISDGAAALVLAAPDAIPTSADADVVVDASVHRTGQFDAVSSVTDHRDEDAATEEAYGQADVTVDDVDVFEVHDAATYGELIHCEALGIFDPGAAPAGILDGETAIDGRSPVNPSGGLKARGHPVGATGVAQINELVWQLRGEATGRQVDDARVGLALNTGGGVNGISANYSVHVLRRR